MAVTESKGDGFALYNGVKLPKLPEWDKETYPYAMMTRPILGKSSLFLLSEWEYYYYHNSTSGFSQEGIKYPNGAQEYQAIVDGAEWERLSDEVSASQVIFNYILWANTDVVCQSDYYKPAGSIYLAASDPIPLDGMTVIEWDGNTDGLTVTGTDLGSLVLLSEKVPNTSKPAAEVHISDGGGTQYAYTEKAEYSENGCYYWNAVAWHSYYPNATDIAPTPGIYITSLTANPVTSSLFAFYEGTEEEETDIKPIYMRENGKWVKKTAYERQNGVWVLISKAEYQYFYGRVAQEGETPDLYIGETGYVGAVLPKLPEWDRETYPYAYIVTTVSGKYRIYTTNKAGTIGFYGDAYGVVFSQNDDVEGLRYDFEDGAWVYGGTHNYHVLSHTVNTFKWTNADILNADGTLYLAATDPIPVTGIVAYSYNGTVLPELPEWDKEAYPYAVIRKSQYGENLYFLELCTSAPYKQEDGTIYLPGERLYCSSNAGEEWGELFSGTGISYASYWFIWTNTDILTADGTTYLSASDPIPVYE